MRIASEFRHVCLSCKHRIVVCQNVLMWLTMPINMSYMKYGPVCIAGILLWFYICIELLWIYMTHVIPIYSRVSTQTGAFPMIYHNLVQMSMHESSIVRYHGIYKKTLLERLVAHRKQIITKQNKTQTICDIVWGYRKNRGSSEFPCSVFIQFYYSKAWWVAQPDTFHIRERFHITKSTFRESEFLLSYYERGSVLK